ncbi:MAG TPA: hypothetical protein VHE09_14230 [Rhizomicrobium sp.]|nr:hypothetical protein [Rhizomicrobium sp.]
MRSIDGTLIVTLLYAGLAAAFDVNQHLTGKLSKSTEERGISTMFDLVMHCPNTKKIICTGVRLPTEKWNRDAVFFAYTLCPACGSEHEWRANDVWLSAPISAPRNWPNYSRAMRREYIGNHIG